jgi:peptidase M28-like protein/PA domain-containing protein
MQRPGSISVLASAALLPIILLCVPRSVLAITSAECEARVNDTPSKLVECIQQDALWAHLTALQNISDSNPDPTFDLFPGAPYGSRDSGTAGDVASVSYLRSKLIAAGYTVTIQSYPVVYSADRIVPVFAEVSPTVHDYIPGPDFSSAVFSGSGDVTAEIQAIPGIIDAAPPTAQSSSGCSASDFAGFVPGRIALMERGVCANRDKVLNAIAAGAVGTITMNYEDAGSSNTLSSANGITVPVYSYIPYHVGIDLYHQAQQGAVVVRMKTDVLSESRITYNVIADSKGGDPKSVVVVDAHYDSIYGAGILDNASGSATILEIALKMQNVSPRNQVRFIWFGGEELGLLGSSYYIDTLPQSELNRIAYVMDADVTASPNYIIGVNFPSPNDPFPKAAYKPSALGFGQIVDYFSSVGLNYVQTDSEGTDSYVFNLAGIPGSGILTGQNCCKWEGAVALFGGYTGNYEGNIPGFDGGCVDRPYMFCDNLANNDPTVLEFMSRGLANSVIQLAFVEKLKVSNSHGNVKPTFPLSSKVGHRRIAP